MNLTGLLSLQTDVVDGKLKATDHTYLLIANSLIAIIEEFFVKMTPTITIVCSCRRKSTFYFFEKILQVLCSMMLSVNIQLVYIDHKNLQHINGPGLSNLLLVDSYEAFLDIDVIYFTRNNTNIEYYHVLLMQLDQYAKQDMKSIFSYSWNNDIINCNIQHQNANGEIILYTYFPFTDNKCDNIEPQHIDTFTGKSWTNKTYFHEKLGDFNGCPLVAVARHLPPYSFITTAADGTTYFSGVEVDVLKILAKQMNFTLHFRTRSVTGHATHWDSEPLKMVADGKADLTFGFYRQRSGQESKLSTTFPHAQTKVVAIIYLPAHALNGFEIWLYPFEDYVWYALCISITVLIVITGLMRISRRDPISIFEMLGCALGAPVQREPKLPHTILIFMTWLWSSYIVRILYEELLFHLLRYKIFSFIPKTLNEAVDHNFYAVMNEYMYNDVQSIPLFNNSLNSTSIVLPYESELVIFSYIENNKINDLFAVTNFDYLAHFMKEYSKYGLFYVIPDTIIQQQLCIYMAKHSYLVNQFNLEIMFLRSSGLLRFWARKHFEYNYFVKEELYKDGSFVQEDLVGIYVICVVLYVIAFIVFLIEMLSRKIKFVARLFN